MNNKMITMVALVNPALLNTAMITEDSWVGNK